MSAVKTHADEVPTDAGLVRHLLQRQFPQWAGLPISPVPSSGTDHAIYRLGDLLCTRLPRIPGATDQAQLERLWLPRLARHLPLAIPEQLAMGRPDAGYPFEWSVYRWLPGENAGGALDDLQQAADDLAGFIVALRGIETAGAPPRLPDERGGALVEGDEQVLRSLAELGDRVDRSAAERSWEEGLAAPPWIGKDMWLRGDLLPTNLLALDGRLAAVIDFGCLNVGDPACDLRPAWNLFTGRSRERFRAALDVDDATWLRGRGWALRLAVGALPYYWDTNPGMVGQASRTLTEVLADSAR